MLKKTWNRRILLIALVMMAAGVGLVSSRLTVPLWYDEAWTVMHYALGNLSVPFTVYDVPNNHVLYSAALNAWLRLNPQFDDSWPRLFSILLYAVSIVFLALAAARLCRSRWGGLWAAILFVTSHAAANFAAQVRGYGPSWLPVTVALYLLANDPALRRKRTVAGVILCAAVAVGILPTNLIPFACMGVWILIRGRWVRAAFSFLKHKTGKNAVRRPGGGVVPMLAVLSASVWGILFYVRIWRQVLQAGSAVRTGSTVWGLATEWFGGMDFWWLLPAFAAGVYSCVRLHKQREELSLLASVIGVTALILLLMPQPPFIRSLIPLMPLWCAGWAVLLRAGIRQFCQWHARRRPEGFRRRLLVLTVVLAVFMLGAALQRERTAAGVEKRFRPENKPHGMYDFYAFTPWFRPTELMDNACQVQMRAPGAWFMDEADLIGLRWHQMRAMLGNYRAQDPATFPLRKWQIHYFDYGKMMRENTVPAFTPGIPVYYITFDPARPEEIRKRAGLSSPAEKLGTFGMFLLYRLR